jgi:transposase
VDGRIELPFVLPSGSPTPYERYVLSEEYEFRTSTIQRHQDGEWYARLSTRRYDPENEPESGDTPTEGGSDETPENGAVLGVDLGVRHIAVASTGRFWSASEFNHWKHEYEERRTSMQQVGTRHAHGAMQSVGRKEDGRFTIFLHRVANELVAEARKTGCTLIAFEDLTGIRNRLSAATW